MEKVSSKFYFVSQDLEFLMNKWCACRQPSLKAPPPQFFKKLRKVLRNALQNNAFKEPLVDGSTVHVQFLPKGYFSHLKKNKSSNSFWISLDDVYVENADFSLRVNRIYNKDGLYIGIGPHPETKDSLTKQLEDCKEKWTKRNSPKEVILADDGTFTGESIVEIIKKLKEVEIFVTEIRLGLCTVKSFDKIGQFNINSKRHKSKPLKYWPRLVINNEYVHDWVCERDFFVGVPRSGRVCGKKNRQQKIKILEPAIACPYLDPWGDIQGGASIKKGKSELSQQLNDASIRLWRKIEILNNTKLFVRDMPRFPGPSSLVYNEEIKNRRLVEFLESYEKDFFGSKAKENRGLYPWKEETT